MRHDDKDRKRGGTCPDALYFCLDIEVMHAGFFETEPVQ